MAIIKCPECGHDVSDQAFSCPHCGYPCPTGEPVSPPATPEEAAERLRGLSDPAVQQALREALRGGHKIPAIRHVRERTGVGLAEAREYVEQIETTLAPEQRRASGGTGCMAALAVLTVSLVLIVWSLIRP